MLSELQAWCIVLVFFIIFLIVGILKQNKETKCKENSQ